MNARERADIQDKFQEILTKYYKNKIFIHLPVFEHEHILLYNDRYNLKSLKKIRLKKKKKTELFYFSIFV